MASDAIDVALVRCRELPEPDADEQPLLRALAAAGIGARSLSWDDPTVDWSAVELSLLRATWNYHLDRVGFLAWAERAAGACRLYNPLAVVRWNSHKRYLGALRQRDLPVVPTLYLTADDAESSALTARLRELGVERAVLKPAVSAGSFETHLIDGHNVGEPRFADLIRAREMMLQPYVASVDDHGERALVWIDGEVTHAVRKSPRFAGQDEVVTSVALEADEVALAQRVIGALDDELLYARIDLARDDGGRPMLMELELVEPSLFFGHGPTGLERLVAALRRTLAEGGLSELDAKSGTAAGGKHRPA
jgi:hypothetical protein